MSLADAWTFFLGFVVGFGFWSFLTDKFWFPAICQEVRKQGRDGMEVKE